MPRKKTCIAVDNEDYSGKGWETVVDFTDGGKTRGVPVAQVLKELKKILRK